ncbi:MAG: hypothetical protein M1829_006920 [Trizodia sp. TS-e1964]|nr:MAG: hypothetical protein M1829_006920 [Trizodia sp. TS-e1964]
MNTRLRTRDIPTEIDLPQGIIALITHQNSAGPASGNRSSHSIGLTKELLITELLNERPRWILSAYTPIKDAAVQLFGGYPREQSVEEMRVLHYQAVAAGNEQQAIQEADALYNDAERQIQNVLNDTEGAIKYIIAGKDAHPNRVDICNNPSLIPQPRLGGSTPQGSNPFGRAESNLNTANKASGFNAFNVPSQQGANPFTRPALHQNATPPPSSSPFSQASTLTTPFSSNFQTQPTGAPVASVFSPFGSPSPAQAPTVTPHNPFTQPIRQPFGQPLQPIVQNVFNTQQATPQVNSGSVMNTFSKSAAAFTSPPVFSSQSTVNPFSRPPPNSSSQLPFSSTPFSQPQLQAVAANPTPTSTHGPHVNDYSTRDAQKNLLTWKSRPVSYKDGQPLFQLNDGSWERIWFPNGPPDYNKDTELPEEMYDNHTKQLYQEMAITGECPGGKMPLLPPRREWCRWDF